MVQLPARANRREKRGLVYSIYSFAQSYEDGGLYGVYAGTGEDEVAELIPVMCEEIVKVTNGIAADELMRARAQLKASTLMSLESTSSRCEQLARQIAIYGRPVPVAEVVAKVEAVGLDDVTRVARRLFSSTPSFAAIGPLANVEPYARIVERLGLPS